MKLGKKTKRGILLLGGLAVLFLLVHTPPAKGVVGWIAVRVASTVTDGSATIDRLDYWLWRGEFELSTVSLQPSAEHGFLLRADRIRATVSPTLKIAAEVDGLDLVLLEALGEGPTTDVAGLLAWVRSLRIGSGGIRFRDGADDPDDWLNINGISADLVEDGDEHRLILHADRGAARVDTRELTFDALDVDLYLGPDNLRVVAASLFKDDSYGRAEGTLDLSSGPTGVLDIQYSLDGSLARLIDDELAVVGVVH